MSSLERMPVIIQNWAEQMRDPSNTPAIRYNYFMQFKAIQAFAAKMVEEYEKTQGSDVFRKTVSSRK